MTRTMVATETMLANGQLKLRVQKAPETEGRFLPHEFVLTLYRGDPPAAGFHAHHLSAGGDCGYTLLNENRTVRFSGVVGPLATGQTHPTDEHTPWWAVELALPLGRVTVCGDPFRRCRLYVGVAGTRVTITNRPEWVATHSERWNDEALRLLLILKYLPPPLSLYQGWAVLPVCHDAVVELAEPAPQFRMSYRLPSQPSLRGPEVKKALYAQLVTQSRYLDEGFPGRPAGTLVSGGVDSALVTLAAAEHKPRKPDNFIGLMFTRGATTTSEEILDAKALMRAVGGRLELLKIESDKQEYVDLWLESLQQGTDYFHLGKPAFLAGLRRLANLGVAASLTGQTADTVAEFNVNVGGWRGVLLRFLYSEGLFRHVRLCPGLPYPTTLMTRLFASAARRTVTNKLWKTLDRLLSLCSALGAPEKYYSGEIINPSALPGLELAWPIKMFGPDRRAIAQLTCALDRIRHQFLGSLDRAPPQEVPSLLLHMLFDTLITGADARAIQSAGAICNVKIIMPFLTKQLAGLFTRLKWSERKFWRPDKRLFRELRTELWERSAGRLQTPRENTRPDLDAFELNVPLARWHLRGELLQRVKEDLRGKEILHRLSNLGIHMPLLDCAIDQLVREEELGDLAWRIPLLELWQLHVWSSYLGRSAGRGSALHDCAPSRH